MKNKRVFSIVLVFLPLAVGLLSYIITGNNMDIYSQINKPPLAPPTWLFPLAWSILYLLMGIASAIVYTKETDDCAKETGMLLHYIQLILNFSWSIVFFNMQAYLLSFIWLVLLWLAVLFMLIMHRRVSKVAFCLNILYLLWLTFAAYLNLAIFILN